MVNKKVARDYQRGDPPLQSFKGPFIKGVTQIRPEIDPLSLRSIDSKFDRQSSSDLQSVKLHHFSQTQSKLIFIWPLKH